MESMMKCLMRWHEYSDSVTDALQNLRHQEELFDVTLACEGKTIRAHKLVLAACSQYFRKVFKEYPCEHPTIILDGISWKDLMNVLHFMYCGLVLVDEESACSLLSAAYTLDVAGLNHVTEAFLQDKISGGNEESVEKGKCSTKIKYKYDWNASLSEDAMKLNNNNNNSDNSIISNNINCSNSNSSSDTTTTTCNNRIVLKDNSTKNNTPCKYISHSNSDIFKPNNIDTKNNINNANNNSSNKKYLKSLYCNNNNNSNDEVDNSDTAKQFQDCDANDNYCDNLSQPPHKKTKFESDSDYRGLKRTHKINETTREEIRNGLTFNQFKDEKLCRQESSVINGGNKEEVLVERNSKIEINDAKDDDPLSYMGKLLGSYPAILNGENNSLSEVPMSKSYEQLDIRARSREELDMRPRSHEQLDIRVRSREEDIRARSHEEVDMRPRSHEQLDIRARSHEQLDMRPTSREEVGIRARSFEDFNSLDNEASQDGGCSLENGDSDMGPAPLPLNHPSILASSKSVLEAVSAAAAAAIASAATNGGSMASNMGYAAYLAASSRQMMNNSTGSGSVSPLDNTPSPTGIPFSSWTPQNNFNSNDNNASPSPSPPPLSGGLPPGFIHPPGMSQQDLQATLEQYQRKLAFHEPRPCPTCRRMYRDAATLRTHIAIMHSEGKEPFSCSCGAFFRTKYDMYQHKKNGHR